MYWFFIALAAPILWSFVNVADKFLVSNFKEDNQSSGSLALFSCLVALVACVFISALSHSIYVVSLSDRFLLMLVGLFDFAWIIFYLFAFEIEDTSVVVPWMQTIPIFGYVFGYAFFHEVMSPKQLLGALIILVGALIVSVDFRGVKYLFKKKVATYMLLACFFLAINGVIFKLVASTDSFWVSSFWQYLGLALTGVFVFTINKKWRNQFMDTGRRGGRMILHLNFGTEFMNVAGNLLTNYAVLLAPIAMVYLVSSFQPAIVLIMTFLCTRFWPRIVKEDFSQRVVLPKILAIIIMLAGSFFLFTS